MDELEQWAAVTGEPARLQPRHLVGPWGAVVVVDISSGEELTAFLLAPWEGRPEPSPAERDLLSLIAQVAASALEHSLLYARLRAQTDELNRLAAVQRDFLRGITHDLQTPLTSIRALAADIGQEAKLNAQARADLEAIAHQADRLRRMVGQLLAVSRLEAGALEPRQEVFRVGPIIDANVGGAPRRRAAVFAGDRWTDAAGGRRSGPLRAGPVGRARQRGEVLTAALGDHRPGRRGQHARVARESRWPIAGAA